MLHRQSRTPFLAARMLDMSSKMVDSHTGCHLIAHEPRTRGMIPPTPEAFIIEIIVENAF